MPKNDAAYVETLHAFLKFFRYLRRNSRQIHHSGQSGRQLSTLRYLLDSGPVTMGHLSDYLYITESSTTELVAKLEEAGLAARERSRRDNRVVEVALTSAGKRLAKTTELGGIPLLRERLESLPQHELGEVRRVFDRLNELLGVEEEE